MIIVTILVGLVGLGLMVFLHELGHFIAAKLFGVQVEVFSLGWGAKMVGFSRRGTSYQISWFPIGGYCKMKGEEGLRKAMADDREEIPQEPGSLFAAPAWKRILIYAAGPLFNVISALVIFTVIWWAGFKIYSFDNRVIIASDYSIESRPSPLNAAALAGLKTGDRILSIDGKVLDNYSDLREIVALSAGKTLLFKVERDGQTLSIPVTPQLDKNDGSGKIGVYPWVDPVVDSVAGGSPAAFAGLQRGDRILDAGGKPVRNTIELTQALMSGQKGIALTVERQEQAAPLSVDLIPGYQNGVPTDQGIQWKPLQFHSPRLGPAGALAKSADETWTTAALTVRGIGLLFSGINLRNAVAGPLRITYYIGDAATSGFQFGFGQGIVDFFRFLSFLSVVLFLMNLLPLPALDGGQILLTLIEIIRGRSVRPRTVGRIQFVGFSVLIILSLFITFSDILFFLGK